VGQSQYFFAQGLPLLQLFVSLNVACCTLLEASLVPSTIDIKLRTGIFRGSSTSNGTERWLGIPFALPPVGGLRFKAPVPITKALSATMDASAFRNACPQPAGIVLGAPIAEDCLFLNVKIQSMLFYIISWTFLPRFGGHRG